jgi:hypothetical protein
MVDCQQSIVKPLATRASTGDSDLSENNYLFICLLKRVMLEARISCWVFRVLYIDAKPIFQAAKVVHFILAPNSI